MSKDCTNYCKNCVKLQEKIDKLKQYAKHKTDCDSLKSYHKPDCPKCGRKDTEWGHGLGFEHLKRCLNDDCSGWFEPKIVQGECDCDLEEAMKEK